MPNFQLIDGDKYDGRCAEIYITEKQFLVYHCSLCEEICATFNELLNHLNNEHYENAKEHKYEETANIEIQILQDEEVMNEIANSDNTVCDDQVDENYLDLTNCSGEFFNGELDDDKETISNEQDIIMAEEITLLEEPKEYKDHQSSLETSASLGKRKKLRAVTGMLKSSVITRTKLKPLTRYQPNSMQTTDNNVDRKYICGICGFAFKERCNLRSHLLRHSNQKNFTCSLCAKKFFTKMELRVHEYRHKGVRPYLCNHCGMGFVSNSSLTQHIKKQHSLHRPYKCEECDKSFTNAYQLKNHMVSHSDERSFQCTECTASFKIKKILNTHLKIHMNKRKLRCEYCDLGFGTESALKTHRRNKHHDDHDDYKDLIEEGSVGSDEGGNVVKEKYVENCDQKEFLESVTRLECDDNLY